MCVGVSVSVVCERVAFELSSDMFIQVNCCVMLVVP